MYQLKPQEPEARLPTPCQARATWQGPVSKKTRNKQKVSVASILWGFLFGEWGVEGSYVCVWSACMYVYIYMYVHTCVGEHIHVEVDTKSRPYSWMHVSQLNSELPTKAGLVSQLGPVIPSLSLWDCILVGYPAHSGPRHSSNKHARPFIY